MATSESSGQKPQPFEGNTPFVSPIVQNVLKDTVLEETGIRYTTFKTFLPVQPFDVAQRPSRVFEFHLREFTAFLIPNSKFFFFFLRDPHPSAPFTGGSSSPSARSSTPPPLCSSAGTSVFPSIRQPYRHRTSSLKTHYVDVFFPSLLSRALLGVDGSRRISRRSSACQDRLRVGRESFFA